MTQHSRYSRQILFSPIGTEGQEKLLDSTVLIVGMGALGTVLANHLVRAGVGYVRFVDRDYVESSNLQRQTLFTEQDVADRLPKAIAAQNKLYKINSEIQIEGIVGDVTAANIHDFAQDAEIILDGTDNFHTRYIINDYCFKNGIPYIYGGAVSTRGMQATFIPDKTPCLRCLFEYAGGSTDTCDTIGVLSPIIDMIASYQAIDAIKWLTGNRKNIRQSLLSLDLWNHHQHEIEWGQPRKSCLSCQMQEYPALKVKEDDQITTLCGRETIQITPRITKKRDLQAWSERLRKVGTVEETPFLVRCQIAELTLVLFTDGRVLIQGTEDITLAKSVYSKYIGM